MLREPTTGLRRRSAPAALAIALLLCVAPSGARAQRPLSIGFDDSVLGVSASGASRATWIGRAKAEGATIVRVTVPWASIAPTVLGAGFVASDPSSPGYRWSGLDAAVRQLTAAGIAPLLDVWSAPAWAEGAGRPATAPAGTWDPSPAALAAFASALARRYDGSFPDPQRPGQALPRVRYWQAWNEPNLSVYLNPQWQRGAGGWAPVSADIYRGLLNAFYGAVKTVAASNFVLAAGTAPYGDPPGGERVPPVTFDTALLCLTGTSRLRPSACPDPPHLDALAHHPYGIDGPTWHARNPGDAAVPDIPRLSRLLDAAERFGHVLPRGHKQLWVTELAWDSRPPDPHGYSLAVQARWYEQALYVLWNEGVDTVLWLQIVDSPPQPDYSSTFQGGVYELGGRPKPSALAVRFPFVTQRLGASTLRAWGRAPAGGRLRIEQLRRGRWRTISTLAVASRQVFLARLAVRGPARVRAQVGGQTSLVWTQR